MHPSMVMLGGIEIPYGKNELEAAGGILGEPVEVINMPKTGLPVPANCEIAFEGFIHPDDRIKEGPLGEWTGYYASGSESGARDPHRDADVSQRSDPDGRDPGGAAERQHLLFRRLSRGAVWNQLEAAGIPEVKGVWTHEAGGSRFMLVVSIKTLYGGHSKQAAMVAAHCHAGAYNNRWTIVVDDDIDPTNFNDVIWAMCTRCDPRDQVDIIHGGWSFGARSDVLRHRRRPAQFAGHHRRLHPVPPQEDVPDGRALQQVARRHACGRSGAADLPKGF